MLERRQANPLLRFIRGLAGAADAATVSDGQLLERFNAQGDQDAFATLVQRHGPLVLGVCRRLLASAEDADDAFQATFLMLARKAGSIANPQLLDNWLYVVAYRTALHARKQAANRRVHERQVPAMPAIMSLSSRLRAARSRYAMAQAPPRGSHPNAIRAEAVRASQNSDIGRNTFQPRRISWS